MGGYGFMRHAIDSLKFNRKQKNGKNHYKSKRNTKYVYEKKSKHLKFKPPNKSELIRLNAANNKRAKRIKDITFFGLFAFVLSVVCTVAGIYVVFKQSNTNSTENAEEVYFEKNIDLYYINIEKGDWWLQQGHYDNAIFFFKQAAMLFPNQFDGQYRLLTAMCLNCKTHFKQCEAIDSSFEALSTHFPEEKTKLNGLKKDCSN